MNSNIVLIDSLSLIVKYTELSVILFLHPFLHLLPTIERACGRGWPPPPYSCHSSKRDSYHLKGSFLPRRSDWPSATCTPSPALPTPLQHFTSRPLLFAHSSLPATNYGNRSWSSHSLSCNLSSTTTRANTPSTFSFNHISFHQGANERYQTRTSNNLLPLESTRFAYCYYPHPWRKTLCRITITILAFNQSKLGLIYTAWSGVYRSFCATRTCCSLSTGDVHQQENKEFGGQNR